MARYAADDVSILKGILYDGSGNARYKNCATYMEKPNPGWNDKYYLFPVPLGQIVLNPNLEPNPGWK